MTLSSRPVFIVSAPRSGSTLLRLILDAHPRLAVPPPAWLYELVHPYLYSYGDLSTPAHLRALAEDMLQTPTIQKWPITVPTSADLLAASRAPTFAGLYDALHRRYAAGADKPRWGEKSPRNCFWMDEIRSDFPDAQFVHIIRDGRDMAVDIADTTGMLPQSPYAGMHMWRAFVTAARESGRRLDTASYLELRYEELCDEPERALHRVCALLGEDFAPAMLEHHETPSTETWTRHPGHARAGQPISTEFCGIHRTRLPPPDVEALESVAPALLTELGYAVGRGPGGPSPRLTAQLLESESVSSRPNAAYRQWHTQRRRERREAGVWSDDDRASRLWALD